MSNRIHAVILVSLLGILLAAAPAALAQTTWYVDDDAPNDPGPGDPTISDPLEDGSPAHPFDAIQEAIFVCQDGDTVLVLDGTYTGPLNKDLDFGGMPITVRSENGPESCVIDCEGEGRGFQFRFGEGPDSVLDGFTVTGGYATDDGGGAIYCYGGSSSNPTIMNCIMSANTATYRGGAIHGRDGSSPAVLGCAMVGNSAHDGGAVYFSNCSSLLITDCILSGNSATNTSSGGGGAIYIDGTSTVTITSCEISSNSSLYFAGGIYWDGTGVLSITNTRIAGNVADRYGGGVYRKGRDLTISSCVVGGNSAWRAGGIYCGWNYPATIADCTITGNAAVVNDGGGIFFHEGSSTIINCTISANTAHGFGGGVCWNNASGPTLRDCILWGDMAVDGLEIALLNGSELTVSYSDVEGGWAWAYVPPGCTLNWGDGNIIADPSFTDPDGPDNDPNTWEDNDYHLGDGSPCIDAGDPDFVPGPGERDIDGQMRVWDGDGDDEWRVDMGSDEYGSHCPGDLDADGDVDLSDLVGLLGVYGTSCP